MHQENGGSCPASLLNLPGLASIDRGQNRAEFSNRPAMIFVRKEKAVQGQRLFRGQHLPCLASVGAVQDGAAGSSSGPNVIAHTTDRVKVPLGLQVGRKLQIDISPTRPAEIPADQN